MNYSHNDVVVLFSINEQTARPDAAAFCGKRTSEQTLPLVNTVDELGFLYTYGEPEDKYAEEKPSRRSLAGAA